MVLAQFRSVHLQLCPCCCSSHGLPSLPPPPLFGLFPPFYPLLPLSAEARPACRQAYAGRADLGRRRKGGGRRKRQINNRMAEPGHEPTSPSRRFTLGRGKAGRERPAAYE